MESLNEEHFGEPQFVLWEEIVLFERFKMYWNYRREYCVTSSCVLCREAVLILKCPISEMSQYFSWKLQAKTEEGGSAGCGIV